MAEQQCKNKYAITVKGPAFKVLIKLKKKERSTDVFSADCDQTEKEEVVHLVNWPQ